MGACGDGQHAALGMKRGGVREQNVVGGREIAAHFRIGNEPLKETANNKRVAIARSLANDPKILLADEPTGNLDTENSERIFKLLTELVKREQKALLLATHNPQIASASDLIHEMKDGVVVRSGTPA